MGRTLLSANAETSEQAAREMRACSTVEERRFSAA